MRLFLTLVIIGIGLTLVGFAMTFGSLNEVIPTEMVFAGLALGVVIGPLTVISGLVVEALRRPTPSELAGQKADDYQTWHFRPAGLLILVVALAAFVALVMLGNGAKQSHSVYSFIFGLACVALLSIRKVRNWIFYTGGIPRRKRPTTSPRCAPDTPDPILPNASVGENAMKPDPSGPTAGSRPPVLVQLGPFLLAFLLLFLAVRAWVTGEILVRRRVYRPAADDMEAGLYGAGTLAIALWSGFIGVRRWRRGG